MKNFYNKINSLTYEADCSTINIEEWNNLMKDSKTANKRIINNLLKKLNYSFYKDFSLNLFNPYKYKKTKTHLIVVQSAIEYFFKIT